MKDLSRRRVLSYLGASAAAATVGVISGCGVSPNKDLRNTTILSSYDIVVVGGTPSGIMAARAAIREGATVILIENTRHIGGILTSGLGVTDSYHYEIIGGLSAAFYRNLGAYYGLSSGKSQYTWEPHVAELIFNNYLESSKATVVLGRTVASLVKRDTQIQSITLDDGTVINGVQWIDATYEGDLMAAAGATHTVGRESRHQYGERYAGWGNQNILPISPYLADGSLLPGVNPNPGEATGQADEKIMAYTFRSCLTTNTSNMAPFPMPPGYTPDRFAGTARYIKYANVTQLEDLLSLGPVPKHKYSLESTFHFSTDYPNACWAYPDANWKTRADILQDHHSNEAGFLYFLANDPSVPASIRVEMNRYGMPLDEFTDNGHWPWQMYVREGRRLIGQYVMIQSDITTETTKTDAIGVGQWTIDSHICDRFASTWNGQPVVMYDGALAQTDVPLYQLPFRSMLPQISEVSNLAVTICMSSSHIAFSSLRVEPTLMQLGEAAGTAAGLALKAGVALSMVDITSLQNRLLQFGSVIAIP